MACLGIKLEVGWIGDVHQRRRRTLAIKSGPFFFGQLFEPEMQLMINYRVDNLKASQGVEGGMQVDDRVEKPNKAFWLDELTLKVTASNSGSRRYR